MRHSKHPTKKPKHSLFEYAGDPKVHQTVDAIIQDLCAKHKSDNLEQDIIALFEDIVTFFSSREKDFIHFDAMSPEQKEAIYIELTTIISILKALRHGSDKSIIIKILSKNMIKLFSRSALRHGYVIDEHQILTKAEQERIKTEFIRLTLNAFQRKTLLTQHRISRHKSQSKFRGISR